MKKKSRNYKTVLTSSRYSLIAGVLIFSVVAAGAYSFVVPNSNVSINSTYAAGTWPTEPPAQICGKASILDGPSTPPAGAVVVPAGDNSRWTEPWNTPSFSDENKTFWFAPGIHTLGNGIYDQIGPGNNTTFVGAPGAIIDGQNKNLIAFGGTDKNVVIKYLTIKNFGRGQDNNDQGVVNHDRGSGWTITNNTMIFNDGAAVMLGPNSVTKFNCLKDNGQYGFSALGPQDDTQLENVVFDNNEVVGNNRDDWESLREYCGCTGGGKFWDGRNVVVTNNYVHDNYGTGLWADYNNGTFLFENNWIENNDGPGLFFEISYNFAIKNNTFIRNNIVNGLNEFGGVGDTFPAPAIYISESGGDIRAGNLYSNSIIEGNYFEDNWDGIALWENADRFCRPGEVFDTTNTCPWFDNTWGTRYKTQNITISNNEFRFRSSNVGCTNGICGRNSLFSNYGTWPATSPYKGTVIQEAITFNQNNIFENNVYYGDWKFQPYDASNRISFTQWQAAPYNQDANSTYSLEIPTDPTPPPVNNNQSDINQDGKVDIVDLSILLSAWGNSGSADIDNSGKVDIVDLSILLSNWT